MKLVVLAFLTLASSLGFAQLQSNDINSVISAMKMSLNEHKLACDISLNGKIINSSPFERYINLDDIGRQAEGFLNQAGSANSSLITVWKNVSSSQDGFRLMAQTDSSGRFVARVQLTVEKDARIEKYNVGTVANPVFKERLAVGTRYVYDCK